MTRIDDDDDHDRLRELAQQLPYDRPDAERREAVRSSLLVAATQPVRSNRRWLLAGGGFLAGALAAAAIAMIVISPRESATPHAKIDAPPTAKLEHVISKTDTGTDELVRIRAGVVRLSVPAVKRGDRVRTQTSDAEVEGTGAYEVAVIDDKLQRVTVDAGTARIDLRVDGKQQQVFLAAGETWRPTIVTASMDLPAAGHTSEGKAAPAAGGTSQPGDTSQAGGTSQRGSAATDIDAMWNVDASSNVTAKSNRATNPDVAANSGAAKSTAAANSSNATTTVKSSDVAAKSNDVGTTGVAANPTNAAKSNRVGANGGAASPSSVAANSSSAATARSNDVAAKASNVARTGVAANSTNAAKSKGVAANGGAGSPNSVAANSSSAATARSNDVVAKSSRVATTGVAANPTNAAKSKGVAANGGAASPSSVAANSSSAATARSNDVAAKASNVARTGDAANSTNAAKSNRVAANGGAAKSNGATNQDVANGAAKSNGIAPNPSTTVQPPRVPAVTTLDPPPVTSTTRQSKTEQHFQRGWKLLREGHAGEAAVELAAAADADVNDPLAADARYFQAVALVRSGKSADAERVLVAFLDRAPTSLRRGRAAILLGKLLRDRGDAKSARAWFESALADGDPAIAAAAKAHLDALSPR